MSKHSDRAVELFKSGYNCSQAVFAAFSDKTGLPEETPCGYPAVENQRYLLLALGWSRRI